MLERVPPGDPGQRRGGAGSGSSFDGGALDELTDAERGISNAFLLRQLDHAMVEELVTQTD